MGFRPLSGNSLFTRYSDSGHPVNASAQPQPFDIRTPDVRLSAEVVGEGPAVVLLHGLTGSRRYVVLGSRLLARRGHRMIGYDARGHGESSPAPDPDAYEYSDLVDDALAVLDDLDVERAVLAGSSMGAATAIGVALRRPERVAALVAITPPALAGERDPDWGDSLAEALDSGGVDGFLQAYQPTVGERWRDTVATFTRQRLERNRHPGAVADALRVVPRSRAFDSLDDLTSIAVPALVVGSREESDPGHPLEVARAYAERLPGAELLVEDEGEAPIAWRGAQLSKAIAGFLERRLHA